MSHQEQMSTLTNNDPAAELAIINKKRTALQKLVKLTSMLSRLHQGLQSVLLMGNPTSYIPEKIINNFKSLTDRLETQSTEILKHTLANTDIKINRDIKQVLKISQQDENELAGQIGNDSNLSSELNLESSVAEFKKNAQTSIALRIALKSRNEPVKPFFLPLPEKFINNQIQELDEKETICKNKIQSSMETINHDLSNLIKRADFPEDMKRKLDEMRANLRMNIDYFSSGSPIENMPILSEQLDSNLTSPQTDTPLPTHIEPVSDSNNNLSQPPTKETEPLAKRGLITRTKDWLFTPWNVKWKDIDKYK
ncbi:MAG: hypothetical protein OEY87_10480 [Gammaproteobacteria bacterium]|nr:hypothetical protein [Gammaproteobacteria bacterium]